MRKSPLVIAALLLLVAASVTAYLVTRPDTSPAPATKQAIAAVVVDVLDIEPSSYEVNPRFDVAEPLGVEIRWHPGGSADAHRLHVAVEPADEALACAKDHYDCDTWAVDGGDAMLRWQEETPESDPGILVLIYAAEDEHRSVVYSGQSLHGDPRDQEDLPVSVDQLLELLTDDRFSSTTTQEMVDTDLAKWPKDADAGEAVPTTPTVVAQWMLQTLGDPKSAVAADTSQYGDGAVGAEFRSPGRTTTVVIVPDDAREVPTCGKGWHCSEPAEYDHGDRGQVTTGWRPGVAMVLIELEGRTVLGTVRSPTIDRFPRPAWKFGGAGWDVEFLQTTPAAWSLITTRQVTEGQVQLPW